MRKKRNIAKGIIPILMVAIYNEDSNVNIRNAA